MIILTIHGLKIVNHIHYEGTKWAIATIFGQQTGNSTCVHGTALYLNLPVWANTTSAVPGTFGHVGWPNSKSGSVHH